MFPTIVLATSLSESSMRTLCCLSGLKAAGTQKVILTHVMNIRDVGSLYRQLKALALPALERQAELLRQMGFAVEIEVRLGLPYHEIETVAKERDASLIAVHLTTESLMESAFVGGIAYEVIQRSDRPVLAMKGVFANGGCEPICEEVLQHVLFPTDFSDNAERALTTLLELVATAHPAVTVVHVQETPEDAESTQVALEAIAERLSTAGARDVQVELRSGSPTAELLALSTQLEHSLIVMGSQGAGFIKEVFLGSVSHNLVRLSRQPVLLVPAARERC
jgi:nucleotide-binding universal stress UspA family protein